MSTAPLCPVHQQPATLVDDAAIYGRSFGRVWLCVVAGCDYRVGAHKADGKPKGTMADGPTREARKQAHEVFDGWWKREGIKRGRAYRELAERMGVKVAHIAEMSIPECQRVVGLFRAARGGQTP